MIQRGFLVLALWVLTGTLARADLILSLKSFNNADAPTVSFNLGDTVKMKLIATDLSGTEIGGANLWESFQVLVQSNSSQPNSAAAATVLGGFNTNLSDTAAFDSVALSGGRVIGGFAFPQFASASGDILGQFNFVASAAGPVAFSFNTSQDGYNIVTTSTGAFDTGIGNGLTVVGTSIAVVPEPSSLAVVGLFGLGLASYRRRRVAC